jgi:two-component system, cell cycle sensor histidine kinase and response regulator CckA
VGTVLEETYRRAIDRNEPQSLEEFHYAPLGTWFAVDAYPTDQGLAVYFRDVTQAHETRAALERQAMLLDLAQDAIIVRDMDHRITYWNASAERIYGWAASEAVGQDIRELLGHDPDVYESAMTELLTAGGWSGEITKRTRGGQDLVVATRWTLIEDDVRPNVILTIDEDITERTRTEQQMLRAQRLESLGTLAGGIAHDLNNTLAPILLATELLTTRDITSDQRELLDTIQASARRSADLVEQVLLFARGVEGNRVPIDVGTLLHDVQIIVKDTFPRNVRLITEVPEGLATVLGDSTQLQQVVLNLAVNARDAMPDGGELTIMADQVTLDAQYAASHPEALPDDYVRIVVADTGIGMTQETQDRLFEPFFTTKAPGVGTGLGLPTSAAIVRSHGGFMQVYSELDAGTRFHVYLPVTTEPVAGPVEPPAASAAPRGNGELILVVDDEDHVRAMTRQTLSSHGYEVLEAANGAEAISVYAEHREQVDLVMTDMMMPIMDGPATIRALLRLDPGLRIVGASGLHTSGATAQAQAAGVEHFLPKPFNSVQLLEIIADALDAG